MTPPLMLLATAATSGSVTVTWPQVALALIVGFPTIIVGIVTAVKSVTSKVDAVGVKIDGQLDAWKAEQAAAMATLKQELSTALAKLDAAREMAVELARSRPADQKPVEAQERFDERRDK